jgi:hypothetical protein
MHDHTPNASPSCGAATQEPCRRPETRMDIGFSGILTSQSQGITVSATRRAYRRLWTKPSARLELACRFVGTLALPEIKEALSTPAANTDYGECIFAYSWNGTVRRLSICAQPQATYPGLTYGMAIGYEYVPGSHAVRGLVPGSRRPRNIGFKADSRTVWHVRSTLEASPTRQMELRAVCRQIRRKKPPSRYTGDGVR